MLDTVLDIVLRPFVAWWLLAGMIGQVMKTQVFTRERAKEGKVWKWLRKTLPLHPVVVGIVIGAVWPGEIEPGYRGRALSGVLYFGVAGALSVWAFEVLKGVVKKYQGIELSPLPGQSQPPEDRETPRLGKKKQE